MKIAFVGKGGSGKTTLAALTARYLAARGNPVLAIDADINQHLAVALGATAEDAAAWPALGEHLTELKDWLRGTNPRISSAEAMLKTTPPGAGSRLVGLSPGTFLYERCVRRAGQVDLAVTGPFAESDLGVACYHSKVGAVELLLNHMVDGHDEYVVVDMTAGADAFASGLFTRFDATFCVCEPTLRGVGVFAQYTEYAREYGITVHAVGNKVEDAADLEFLREHLGDALLTYARRSSFVRAAERGAAGPISELEEANAAALDTIITAAANAPRDPVRYTQQAVEFHLRNAEAWGNARTGEDLSQQIDPDFVVGYAQQAV
ncbi:hypothetical protein Val02_91280 [Virgisporangium aliadipatigenens]|uniref:CobQ/CobB/MinD/ParA nucleotide binding domain-containing protein n=1 Tax=Virgisporangium aliadipatigenens TaxID=741659 RepID=A0A8J4DXM6_9ACTN|nr:AAA family ATPase [Virgisporangium aliadipatigenens]GIJ52242.1 hypothetical protein Val02_91280 [Virgisporangium aliadipatigenens]